MKKKIGIIGFGNMGAAIAERIKSKYNVLVFDIDRNKTKGLKNISLANSIGELAKISGVIILAIKPQDFATVLDEIKAKIDKKLVVSIAAGISTQFIEKILGQVSVIRVMPNLPARIGKGLSCLCKGEFASEKDLKSMLGLFKFLGITLVLGEDTMEAATALCGSGPGFWAYAVKDKPRKEWKDYSEKVLIPQFILAAESIGFDKKQSHLLAERIVRGSLATIEAWKITPEELKMRVASKGGTTEAGLEVLQKGGTLKEAVKAALNRAKELSRR